MNGPAAIQVLPDILANQIAAGEVIERPAAVVKELVENAMDAGARRIEVDLLDGGRRLVRVRDDGSGMGAADAELSIRRHATSKLRAKEDLFDIRSYGFRGEALPSIAAVSRFLLLTALQGAPSGIRVEVEGGVVGRIEPDGAPPGTTVEVRDLFWNVPARRKFLKRAAAESALCVEAVLRLAAPRRDVHFTVREGERVLLRLEGGDGETALAARAEEAFGREVRGRLLPFSGQSRGVRAHGLAVSPALDFGNARNVWLFVNGRAVKDRGLVHAALRAFGEVIPHGRYPGALVFVDVPVADVDVNVHPAKSEVRLADARAAWEAVHAGLSAALASRDWLRSGAASVSPTRAYALQPAPPAVPGAAEGAPGVGAGSPPSLLAPAPFFRSLRYLGQLHRTYLVCEGEGGLVLVDQHAAHERVQYQRLRRGAASHPPPAQRLLVPQVAQVPAASAETLAAHLPLLAGLGLELEPFGPESFAVKALPAALSQLDERRLPGFLQDLAVELAASGRPLGADARLDAVLARAACHASVRAHDVLAPGEAQALLDALDVTDYGARCAHGRPVVAEWPAGEIEKRFGRDYGVRPRGPDEGGL